MKETQYVAIFYRILISPCVQFNNSRFYPFKTHQIPENQASQRHESAFSSFAWLLLLSRAVTISSCALLSSQINVGGSMYQCWLVYGPKPMLKETTSKDDTTTTKWYQMDIDSNSFDFETVPKNATLFQVWVWCSFLQLNWVITVGMYLTAIFNQRPFLPLF